MKKYGLIALVAVLILAYPAAAWYFGKRLEATVTAQYDAVKDQPYVKMLQRDYQRGIYRSRETVTMELFGDLAKSRQGAGTDPATPQLEPVRLTVRTEYRHGPLADFVPAMAAADSEVHVEPTGGGARVAELFGDKSPLSFHTLIGFTGAGTSRVISPPAAATLAGKEGAIKLDWGGLEATAGFNADLSETTLHGSAPKLEAGNDKQGSLKLVDLRIDTRQKRIFADDPMMLSGTQNFSIGRLDILPKDEHEPVTLQAISFAAEMPLSGDFVDLIGRLTVDSLQVGQKRYGPAHYDYSLHHLQTRKLAAFYHVISDLSADPALAQGQPPAQVFGPLAAAGLELLKDDPELRLDRLSFRTDEGEAVLSARARLAEALAQDFANPASLMAKLDAGAELTIPEKLLDTLATGLAKSPEEAETNRNNLKQQLAAAIQQSFALREGGLIKSKAEFAKGQLSVNGKAVPLGGPGTAR